MKKCFLCEKNNTSLYKVRNGGYICNDCYWTCTSRFAKCDECGVVIDMDTDYIGYCNKTGNDVCEDCYLKIMNNHSHHYEPKVKFIHKRNSNRANYLHIGTELELLTINKKDFLKEYLNKYKEFYFKDDGSIGERRGIEIVSMPMTYNVIEECWKPLFNILNQYEFYPNSNCGLHFHLDKRYLDDEIIRNIDYVVNNFHGLFSKIGGRSYLYNDFCRIAVKDNNCWGLNTLGKYTAVNLMKVNTVEIRICASTNEYDKFIERLKYMYALVEYCKHNTFYSIRSTTSNEIKNELNKWIEEMK